MVLRMIAQEAKIKEIQIPGVGLKDGVLWDMLPLHVGSGLPQEDQAWTSAMRLGQKYHFDAGHGMRVARTAQSLFDQLVVLHELEAGDRMLLRIACLLHDVGHFIGAPNHDRHGYYILKNSHLIGLDECQQDMIAVIVRNHRNATLKSQEEHFKALGRKDQETVVKLCALLRLADAIEVSHTNRIHNVKMKETKHCWQLDMQGEGNLLLERWALSKRKSLFEEAFMTRLEVLD
jgi:exopolyphosphatase/guanosine-5'-triphosphate,3'-diphosphate pyrophosphatase